MGQSPQDKAIGAAQTAANQAEARQQQLLEDFQKRAEGYEAKALEAAPKLGLLAGTSPEDYVKGTRQGFEQYVSGLQGKYEPLLTQFDPNLLGSPSQQRLVSSLAESTGEFNRGISDASRRSASDLYQTLAAAVPAAEQIAGSPGTNLMLDPLARALSERPPVTPKKSAKDLGYVDYMRYSV